MNPRRAGNPSLFTRSMFQTSDLSSGADSTSPRKDEAPPGLAPLGEDDDPNARGNSSDSSGTPAVRADVSVQVAFPPDFDDSRKGSSDSDDGGKARSGGSLGTKSGSTSLLSMLSGSPRSLGTVHDSAAGSPSPRTPLSDHSSPEGAAAAGARSRRDSGGSTSGSGSRGRSGGRRGVTAAATVRQDCDVAHEPWSSSGADADRPAQSRTGATAGVKPGTSRSASGEDLQESLPAVSVIVEGAAEGDDDVPSAHPTPLSTAGRRMCSPSPHPTPLSTLRPMSRNGSSRGGDRGTSGDGGGSGQARNPNSSSFMQRLKYWGGRSGSSGSVKTRSAHGSGATSPRTRQRNTAEKPSPDFSVGSSGTQVEPSTCSEGGFSPLDTRGVKMVPFDTVASDAASAFASATPTQVWRATEPPQPFSPLREQEARVSPSSRHRKADSRSGDDLAGLAPLGSSSKARQRGDVPSYSESVAAAAAAARDTASGSASRKSTGFGAAHRAKAEVGPSPVSYSKTQPTVDIPSPSEGVSARGGAADTGSGSGSGLRKFASFGAGHRAELAALRRARGTPAAGDEQLVEEVVDDEEEEEEAKVAEVEQEAKVAEEEQEHETAESEMDWDALSPDEDGEEKREQQVVPARTAEKKVARAAKTAASSPPHSRGLGLGVAPAHGNSAASEQLPPPPPRYMAIVEAANVTSALDHSSTSEQDTSPSEDDGGMMAEILTDRLMEVCNKMEAVAAPPAEELSDGGGDGTVVGAAGKRRPSMRRRQASNMSSTRTFNKDQVRLCVCVWRIVLCSGRVLFGRGYVDWVLVWLLVPFDVGGKRVLLYC